MTTCTDLRSVFDLCHHDEALMGLREVTSSQSQTVYIPSDDGEEVCPEDDGQQENTVVREVSEKMVCSACRCTFISREEQMEHYKLDWHRFNLRQKIEGMPPVTVDEFETKTGAGDMSSISGSESDSGEEDSDNEQAGTNSDITRTDNDSSSESCSIPRRNSSKIVFQNSAGEHLSICRCILHGKSDVMEDVGSALKAISKKTVWVILMTGGGHFAGAVFQGEEVLQHKTFHRYTVRAKRGTAQGLRDAQNRSHAPKSAGAALRRYNEAALVKDIQDLLGSWAEHVSEASAIFIRAPSYNKTIFFSGNAAPLEKKDPRIRTLPFATRRATFREVKRVHKVLSTVHVYGKDTDITALFSPSKKAWKKNIKTATQNEPEVVDDQHSSSSEEDGVEIHLETVEMTLGTLDLREFEIQPSQNRKRRRRKKEKSKLQNEELNTMEANDEEGVEEATPAEDPPKETQSKNRKKKAQIKKQIDETVDESWEYSLRDALFTACKVGDMALLCELLHLPVETSECPQELGSHIVCEQQPPDDPSPLIFLNKPIDSSGFTLLHVAAAAAQKVVVRLLMDVGADPACRDIKGQTPYIVAPDKDTRNVFRKYMGENPEKYNYVKAQVPGPLTAEIESKKSDKKKAQKAVKKQREKEQKEERRKQELEEEEKKRFASLTDREKRALAAERRLADQVAASGVNLSNIKRCWTCGDSLLGKIPFQYLEYSFCTPRCVQEHRKGHTKS
ncbi:tRNA endonuclease ANKZF1 [Genypterus blacodes]|uniref:tRNA endonuclease ANKZF1 n=1 Tax=Genypterus blacodes TaxID=154954 RepID=UPI003F772509